MLSCKDNLSAKKNIQNRSDDGIDYPFDLWFLLSRYIYPEDIGKFAVLCRSSAAVLHTMSFWMGLYNRYYNIFYEERLPNILRSVNIRRCICIRVNVIRVLYHMYFPFRERSVAIVPNVHVHPELLIGRTCMLAWHEICPVRTFTANGSDTDLWRYNFKLKVKDSTKVVQHMSDIWRNPEEGCKLLHIICMNFVQIPSVESLVLTSVALRLTHSLLNYKLELQFESEVTALNTPRNLTNKRPTGGVIVLDPVVSLTVLDWWHPNYPHANIVQIGEDEMTDEMLENPLIAWDQ